MNELHKIKFLLSGLVAILAFSVFFTVQASTNAYLERSNKIALQALSEKLKTDLGTDDINLKFDKVNQYNISKSKIGVKGNGKYFIHEDIVTPITFDVKVNMSNFSVEHVSYDFEEVDDSLTAVGSQLEENITQKLLKKIGADYKTANVTVAIDNLEPTEQQLTGTGEVRVGDFDWYRIEFNAFLNKGDVGLVSYKILK